VSYTDISVAGISTTGNTSMSTHPDLWLYLLLVAGVVILPGMDMAFVMASSLTSGTRGGFSAVGGLMLGGVVHVVVAATGIAAVLVLVPAAFNVMLLAGAVYVAWLGIGLMRASGGLLPTPAQAATGMPVIFWRALLTCLLNPKAYAFSLAVLPLFLTDSDRSLPVQAALIGGITAAVQLVVYGVVALASAKLARAMADGDGSGRWLARGVGALLIAVAVLTVVTVWRPTNVPAVDDTGIAPHGTDDRGPLSHVTWHASMA
jgi:threonine/homoserine/homoserine lactone efflux protein